MNRNGFYVGKHKAGFHSRILNVYTNLFFDPKIKIDFGLHSSVSLECQKGFRRCVVGGTTRYKEYQCHGICIDVNIVFFRLGIYFTPIFYKFKHKYN